MLQSGWPRTGEGACQGCSRSYPDPISLLSLPSEFKSSNTSRYQGEQRHTHTTFTHTLSHLIPHSDPTAVREDRVALSLYSAHHCHCQAGVLEKLVSKILQSVVNSRGQANKPKPPQLQPPAEVSTHTNARAQEERKVFTRKLQVFSPVIGRAPHKFQGRDLLLS